MLQWRDAAPFQTSHAYPPGQAPADHHPIGCGRLEPELARFGELGADRQRVVVRSTQPRADGWSFHVVEMEKYPAWISYFRNAKTGTRVQSHRSDDPISGQLAQAFQLYEWA